MSGRTSADLSSFSAGHSIHYSGSNPFSSVSIKYHCITISNNEIHRSFEPMNMPVLLFSPALCSVGTFMPTGAPVRVAHIWSSLKVFCKKLSNVFWKQTSTVFLMAILVFEIKIFRALYKVLSVFCSPFPSLPFLHPPAPAADDVWSADGLVYEGPFIVQG